jgi:tRNA(Ile)-lysidine synthase
VHKLAQRVLAYVRNQELLRAGDRVGVAVSGGADSVALLRLMLELRQEIGIVVSVMHLNHKLRGAESGEDAKFVQKLADELGLELISEVCDVKACAAKRKLGIEAAARDLRYEFFGKALGQGLNRIATAHTLDDQAETVLLKLARGAGTRGMAGIWPEIAISHQPSAIRKNSIQQSALSTQDEPSCVARLGSRAEKTGYAGCERPTTGGLLLRSSAIVRPLLGTRRSELRAYLSEIRQAWREDSSNRDLRHTRNRVRHGILPRIERHVNPQVCETLAEMAEIARAEEEYWSEEVARCLPEVWKNGALDRTRLAAFPVALQRRLVKSATESSGLALEFGHIEAILELKPRESASLPHGWRASHSGDAIELSSQADECADYQYALTVPGQVLVRELRLQIDAAQVNGGMRSEGLLDPAFARRRLVVRNWRTGERFWPAHSKEPKKIKELLQDRHITGEQKKRWPVIASGDEVVWMRGFGVRRDFRAKSEEGILIRELPIEE